LPMVPIHPDRVFAQNPAIHSHTTLFDHFHVTPSSSSKHLAHVHAHTCACADGEISFLP
jgi:hypothetical protein